MAAPVLIEAAQFVKEKKADQAQKLLDVSMISSTLSPFKKKKLP